MYKKTNLHLLSWYDVIDINKSNVNRKLCKIFATSIFESNVNRMLYEIYTTPIMTYYVKDFKKIN